MFGRFCQRAAVFNGWKPSTSFSCAMASITFGSLICFGRGNCTRIPSTESSAFSSAILPSNSASGVSSGNLMVVFLMPTTSQALALFFTYVWLPGSLPTRITTRCGTRPYFSGNVATCLAISAFRDVERSFPLIIINQII